MKTIKGLEEKEAPTEYNLGLHAGLILVMDIFDRRIEYYKKIMENKDCSDEAKKNAFACQSELKELRTKLIG